MKKYQYYFDNKSHQKENLISTNQENAPEEPKHHIKSTSSTNQHTNHRASTDNLYVHKIQSLILDLQRQADQQQFEIQSLTEQSTMYMKTCEDQKQMINSLNVQSLKSQYEQQIKEMVSQRHKIQEMISQLRNDYQEAFSSEEAQLSKIKSQNQEISKSVHEELDRKKDLLSLIQSMEQKIKQLNQDINEAQEEMDELRNIQRKLNIALRQAQLLEKQPFY